MSSVFGVGRWRRSLSDRQLHHRRQRVKFPLTSSWPSVFFIRITEDQLQFTPDMKKLFVLSMLISFAIVCSCQKQDSAVEQQLAQRKAELDAREKTLDEREKALAERERAMASRRVKPADVQPQGTIRDPAQVKAERDKRIQQLPPELQLQGLIADPSRDKADKDSRMQERLAQRQRRMEELQKARMSRAVKRSAATSPEAEATSPTPSPAVEATSPSPSPTP